MTTQWMEAALRKSSLDGLVERRSCTLPALRLKRDHAVQLLEADGVTAADTKRFIRSVWLGPAKYVPPPPPTEKTGVEAAAMGKRSLKNAQSDHLAALLADTPGILGRTAAVLGNRAVDLHPCVTPAKPTMGLNDKVCVIGGASRGIGQGIAVRFGKAGAKVCVMGRSDGKIITGPGTLSEVVSQINKVGGKGLAVQCDLGKPEQVTEAIKKITTAYGRIDVLVNNASALYPEGVEAINTKRFDLMNNVCLRGAYLLTREALPHMFKSACPHVLTVAPAPIGDRTWMGPHVCYSGTKIGMGMLAAAWSAEFPNVHFNTIWPHKMVATFAVTNTVGADLVHAVTVAHMADPAYRIVTSEATGRFYLDTGALEDMGIKDRSTWNVDPKSTDLFDDFMIEPLGLKEGQKIEYLPMPASDLGSLNDEYALLVGINSVTSDMTKVTTALGATVQQLELTADVPKIEKTIDAMVALDAVYISAGPTSTKGTLETDVAAWEALFDLHCKGPYYVVAKALPMLRRSARPRVVMVAPAPVCSPKSFASPAVPCALISQVRGLYVTGMAVEFDGSDEELGKVAFNGIWDGMGGDPPSSKCIELLASASQGSGNFYATDLDAIPEHDKVIALEDYTRGCSFTDHMTTQWMEAALRKASLTVILGQRVNAHLALRMDESGAIRYLEAADVPSEAVRTFMDRVWLGPAKVAKRQPLRRVPIGRSFVHTSLTVRLQASFATSREAGPMLACGCDVIGEVPPTRWSLDDELPEPYASKVRHGHFVSGAQLCDAAAFSLSSAEAYATDPHQRILLEHGYQTLHDAGFDRAALLGSLTGLFLGYASTDFLLVLAESPAGGSIYAATATASIASGRLSYVLGLHGPCSSYDSACSATLVACHAGLRAVQKEECGTGLVAGVMLMLAPNVGTGFAIAGMTSPNGRSHTFDAHADGYARGEGVGGVALHRGESGSDASLGANGSAVRQDGKSASLTAPSGLAQKGLIIAALRDADIKPDEIMLSECHGTGTPLGDPIEAGSYRQAVLSQRSKSGSTLALDSIKANRGHAEAAAGITGLLRLELGLKRSEAAPNAQLRKINPHVAVNLKGVSCALPVQLAEVALLTKVSGGVSSFGYSGTIAHTVLVRAASSQLQDTMSANLSAGGAVETSDEPVERIFRRRPFTWNALQEAATANKLGRVQMYATAWEASPLPAPFKSVGSTLLLGKASGMSNEPKELPLGKVAALVASYDSTAASVIGMELLRQLAKEMALGNTKARAYVITRGVLATDETHGTCNPSHGGAWGLARVLRLEKVGAVMQCADVQSAVDIPASVLLAPTREVEAVWRGDARFVARMRESRTTAIAAKAICRGTFTITGGLGGLGVRSAMMLAGLGASKIVLVSRSGAVDIRQLASIRSKVKILPCDVAESEPAKALLRSELFAGVLHAAGVLRDKMLRTMERSDFIQAFAPKAGAAACLDHAVARLGALKLFGLFSSVASAFGNIGQGNYAAANSYLDSLAFCRRLKGIAGSALQILPVLGSGMGAATFDKEQLAELELQPISLDEFAKCLALSLGQLAAASQHAQVRPIDHAPFVLPVYLHAMHLICRAPGTAGEDPQFRDALSHGAGRSRKSGLGPDGRSVAAGGGSR